MPFQGFVELSMAVGVLFWVFLLWLAWSLVKAMLGVHRELIQIRQYLGQIVRDREGTPH